MSGKTNARAHDLFPFTGDELKRRDRKMIGLLEKLWNTKR